MQESQLKSVIINILGNDNEVRKYNELQLATLKQQDPNQLFNIIINLLQSKIFKIDSKQIEIRQFCAIYLRKNLSGFSENNFQNQIQRLSPSTISLIKSSLFNCLEQEQFTNVRHLICQAIGEIGGTFYHLKNTWPELNQQIFSLVQSSSESNIDSGLHIFSVLYPYASDSLTNFNMPLLTILQNCLVKPNFQLASFNLLSSIIGSVDKNIAMKYSPLINLLLNCLISSSQSSLLIDFLAVMVEITEAEPKFFKADYQNVYETMKNLVFDKQVEQKAKETATEVLMVLAERIPSLVKNQEQRLRGLLEMIFFHMVEIDIDVSQDWEKPKEGFTDNSEDSDDDSLKFGISCIDRLISGIGEKIMLPTLSALVLQMFSLADWRYKNAAIMALSQVGEYIDDINEVGPIVNIVLNFCKDPNPKIRYSICHCIGQISDDMKPEFQEIHHENVMESIGQLLYDPIPRVQAHAAACLTNFFEGMNRQQLQKYLKPIITRFFEMLQNSISIVKENVVSAIANLSDCAKEDIRPYYDEAVTFLFKMMENHPQSEYRELRGHIVECMTMMANAVKWQSFQKYAPATIEMMLMIQNSTDLVNDPQKIYLLSGWQRLCTCMGLEFAQYLQKIIPSLFKLIKNTFSLNNSQLQNINTSDTQEAEICIQMLKKLITCNETYYAPFIEETLVILIPILQNCQNDEIRKGVAECFPPLLKSASQDIRILLGKQIISCLFMVIETENLPDILEELVLSLSDCIEIINQKYNQFKRFLNEQEINEIQQKIFNILMQSDKRKQENEVQINQNDLEDVEVENLAEENEMENDLHISVSELIGIIFKTQNELSIPMANNIYNNLLSKALQQNQGPQIHRFGINIVNDMIEHLGINLQIFQKEFQISFLIFVKLYCVFLLINHGKSDKHLAKDQESWLKNIKIILCHYLKQQQLKSLKPLIFLKVLKSLNNMLKHKIELQQLCQKFYKIYLIKVMSQNWLHSYGLIDCLQKMISQKFQKIIYIQLRLQKKILILLFSMICKIYYKDQDQILETKYSNQLIDQLIQQDLIILRKIPIVDQNWNDMTFNLTQNQKEKIEQCFNN